MVLRSGDHGATTLRMVVADDVAGTAYIPRPGGWSDRRLVAAVPQGARARFQPSKHTVICDVSDPTTSRYRLTGT